MKIFFLFKQMELREAKNKNKEKPSQPKLFLEKLCLEKLINIVSNCNSAIARNSGIFTQSYGSVMTFPLVVASSK